MKQTVSSKTENGGPDIFHLAPYGLLLLAALIIFLVHPESQGQGFTF